ncbi:hypothetical protein CEE37_01110 [candidate division LCP-89 bacterium B3_LCP]|uniref:Formylmethanofuran dehydrogenase subunit E domain-containing protein n=1 Tax=candidate division LCP-89 bacterium B3_LCP TaxID=2012998 RepID=A0A532V551_UNCL8|nr:MAG: hypothetical protein CEE37_01110 [candidate division LCP-89 bacterium B3_LCP]
MINDYVNAELMGAKKFHGHLGPYLVIGMRMGHLISSVLGDKPFSYRIHASVGWNPPPSCVIDGLQLTTPCTVGNSMIRVEELGDIEAWAKMDAREVKLRLIPQVRKRIDEETTKENEETFAGEIWEAGIEELFELHMSSS